MCTVAMPPASAPSAGLIRKSMDCGGGAIVECSQRQRDQPVPLTGLLEPPRDSDEWFDTQKASRYHQRYPTHAVTYPASEDPRAVPRARTMTARQHRTEKRTRDGGLQDILR